MSDTHYDLVNDYGTVPKSPWFHYCRQNAQPYVVIRGGEKTADVMWDYVNLPPHYDKILFGREKEIQEQAAAIFYRHATEHSSIRVKPTVVFFDNLPPHKAKLAAKELYAFIESLLPTKKFV